MENLENCPVCGHQKSNKLFSCKDYVASGENFDVVACINCTLQYTNPRPSFKEIGPYYQSKNYVSHAGQDKGNMGLTYRIYDLVSKYNIGRKLRQIKEYHKGGKLLDLGCGLGYFLNGVKQDKTFDCTGADVSNEAIEYVDKTFGIKVVNEEELHQLPDNSFDIITQWHVMEHVHKLEERMVFLKRVLKEDGTMFIAVPNSGSFDAKYYKEYWDGYDVPRHIFHFTRKSFSTLMEKNGFKVVSQRAMIFDGPYISMRSEYHQKNAFGFIKGAIIGGVSTLSAWFTKDYSSIMFVVKHKKN